MRTCRVRHRTDRRHAENRTPSVTRDSARRTDRAVLTDRESSAHRLRVLESRFVVRHAAARCRRALHRSAAAALSSYSSTQCRGPQSEAQRRHTSTTRANPRLTCHAQQPRARHARLRDELIERVQLHRRQALLLDTDGRRRCVPRQSCGAASVHSRCRRARGRRAVHTSARHWAGDRRRHAPPQRTTRTRNRRSRQRRVRIDIRRHAAGGIAEHASHHPVEQLVGIASELARLACIA